MWLLHAASLTLENVVEGAGDEAHAYAILSHTWEEDEVTFRDLVAGTGRAKKGYGKIAKTCERAMEDGLEYAWIDTCCINKESSAELHEAVNSMWPWYCNARVCYAYLSDMDGWCPELSDREHDRWRDVKGDWDDGEMRKWHAAFGSCRWFARGWTLQELLAPRQVAFYGRDWNFIGSKNDLVETISEITGIDHLVLEDREFLSNLPIARKMSWAAGRDTTRIEDRAYSLLGIFGINMPLLYGEGDKAFVRLQEELVRTTTDHSILVWQSEREAKGLLPDDMLFAQSPDEFRIGRKIVRWQSKTAGSPYRLTNTGLQFDSIFLVRSHLCAREAFGVLNCRFEDDLRGPLALRLYQRDPVTPVSSIWQPPHNSNEFWIGGNDATRPTQHDRLLQSGRLMVYSDFDFKKLFATKIIVFQNHPVLHRHNFSTTIAWPKIWLKADKNSSEDVEILAAHPEKDWNRATGVMCPPIRSELPYFIEGSVALRFKQSGTVISVAFSYPIEVNPDGSTRRQYKIVMHKTSDQQRVRRLLQDCPHGLTAEMSDKSDNRYLASMEFQHVLEDLVCLVQVSMIPGLKRRFCQPAREFRWRVRETRIARRMLGACRGMRDFRLGRIGWTLGCFGDAQQDCA